MREDEEQVDRLHAVGPSGLERHVQTILQILVVAGIVWLTSNIIDLSKTSIRVEERSTSVTASSARIEADIGSLKNQLLTMDRSIQSMAFKQEEFERRMKGVELLRERMR